MTPVRKWYDALMRPHFPSLLAFSAQKINRQHVQLVFVLVSLALLVLGTGAPTDGGGVTK